MFNDYDDEEDYVELSDKEEEIEDYYNDEEEYEEEVEEEIEEESFSDEEYEEIDEFDETGVLEENRARRRFRIILLIILFLLALFIIIDIVAVTKFDKGPFFAIPVKTYEDGGTKEYYGLGYKVIKYHQVQGRRDKELGLWTLEYNTNAITVRDKDLAIAFTDNPIGSYQKYNKKFVRIQSTLQEVDSNNSRIMMAFIDANDKYTLHITCDVVKEQINLSAFIKDKKITIIGTIKEFKTVNGEKTLYVSNCFAEQ